MTIILKATKSITTADGATFSDRKTALAHATRLAQVENLKKTALDTSLLQVSDSGGWSYLQESDIATFIAENAAVILASLTVKQARGPRKAKTPVAQPVATQVAV